MTHENFLALNDCVKTIREQCGFIPTEEISVYIEEELFEHGFGYPELVQTWERIANHPITHVFGKPRPDDEIELDVWEAECAIDFHKNKKSMPQEVRDALGRLQLTENWG